MEPKICYKIFFKKAEIGDGIKVKAQGSMKWDKSQLLPEFSYTNNHSLNLNPVPGVMPLI